MLLASSTMGGGAFQTGTIYAHLRGLAYLAFTLTGGSLMLSVRRPLMRLLNPTA